MASSFHLTLKQKQANRINANQVLFCEHCVDAHAISLDFGPCSLFWCHVFILICQANKILHTDNKVVFQLTEQLEIVSPL